MFTPKRPAERTASSVFELSPKHASRSSGSSDSDVTAFAVQPFGPSSSVWLVSTLTPVAQCAISRLTSSM